jgi:hypothetical protein
VLPSAQHRELPTIHCRSWSIPKPGLGSGLDHGALAGTVGRHNIASSSCCRISGGSRSCALRRPRALAASLCIWRHRAQLQPEFHRAMVPCAAREPRRWRCASVTSRTLRSCSTVHGDAESSPSESHLRTTGGDTSQAAAACRTEKREPFSICLRRLTTRTLAAFTAPQDIDHLRTPLINSPVHRRDA